MSIINELQKFSDRNFEGRFVILKYDKFWRVIFGIPTHEAINTVLPEFKTLEEAAKFAIDNYLNAEVIESAWDFACENIGRDEIVDWDTFLFDLAKNRQMSLKDYMVKFYLGNTEEED